MVVILSVLLSELMGMEHERCTSPSMWTEQAPHWAMPQPYLVPVKPSCSRNTQSNGMSPSPLTSTTFPFTFNLTMAISSDRVAVPNISSVSAETEWKLSSHSCARIGASPASGGSENGNPGRLGLQCCRSCLISAGELHKPYRFRWTLQQPSAATANGLATPAKPKSIQTQIYNDV